MYLHHFGQTVEVHAPAKLNLFLEVLGKRADGFHDLETLMTTVDIFDSLRLTPTGSRQPLQLTSRWAYGSQVASQLEGCQPSNVAQDCGLGDLPEGEDNIVFSALEQLRKAAGLQRGARVELVKRIPSSAGLGGASSDAAAALLAANVAWELNWTRTQLAEVAAEIGSDVPFFLFGGLAVCRGRGEQVTPLPRHRPLHFVVVRPPEGISTAEAFANCQPASDPQSVAGMAEALSSADSQSWIKWMLNRLQSSAAGLSPWIQRLVELFERFDFLGHQMTGSGSSYFGVCQHAKQARRLACALRSLRIGHVLSATSLSTRPVYFA